MIKSTGIKSATESNRSKETTVKGLHMDIVWKYM